MKQIFVVLTLHDILGDAVEKTGFWPEELAAPDYSFIDAWFALTLASPAGGKPPLDPKSNLEAFQTDETRRFVKDEEAQRALANTKTLSDV